jgi:hypothetical protein
MLTEKYSTTGYVTPEMLRDSFAAQDVVVELFKRAAIKGAEAHGYVVLRPPVVHFSLPSIDSPWYGREMVVVQAVARVVKVTSTEPQVFSQGAINLC